MHICSEPVLFRTEGTPPTHALLGGFRNQLPTNWTSSPCGTLALTCVCVCGFCLNLHKVDTSVSMHTQRGWMCVCIQTHVYLCRCVYCTYVCQRVLYSTCASCPVLPSGRMCNGDKLLLLASRGFTADLLQVCAYVFFRCGLCYTKY